MTKRLVLLTAAAVFAGLLPAPAAAQVPGIGIRIVPKIGMYKPLGDIVDGMKTENHLAFGIAAELQIPLLPMGIRANVDYTPATDIMDGSDVRVGTVKITNIVGDLVLRPLPGIIPVQPYLFAGGGVKRYKFNEFTTSAFGSSDDSSQPTLHVGAGVEFNLGVMGLVVEGGDYLSRFKFAGNTKLQNDAYGMVGIKVGLL